MKKQLIFITLLLLSILTKATDFFITNTKESGIGSLRQAIIEAQSGSSIPPFNLIFNIPKSDTGYNQQTGIWTIIFKDEPLPPITSGYLNIDGSTQTLYAGNTNPYGPEICLNGNSNSVETCFLIHNSASSTICNLIINEFLYGIQIFGLHSTGNSIKGNYIGSDHLGLGSKGNYNAIEILSGANQNTIGGPLSSDRNLISGNKYAGIRISDANNNTVTNNWVGVDISGTKELHNYDGITIEGASSGNKIGGSSSAERNITSGNIAYGIDIFGAGCFDNLIIGNFIGTDHTGTFAIPNTYGILFDDRSHNNIVGGYNQGEGNLISGNTAFGAYFYNNGTNSNSLIGNLIGTDILGSYPIPNETGVHIDGASYSNVIDKNIISGNKANGITLFATFSNYNLITRNYIGTDISGLHPLPNEMHGILITQGSAYNQIGGSENTANTIAFNKKNGVKIESDNSDFNLLSCNSFHDNGQLGIDLYPDDGINKNDPFDIDNGPNDLLNSPVIDTVIFNLSNTFITGSLDVQSPETTSIEIYKAKQNKAGISEGISFLANTTCDKSGKFTFSLPPSSNQTFFVALAIDKTKNTSEFSIEYPKQPPLGESNNLTTFQSNIICFPNPANNSINIIFKNLNKFKTKYTIYKISGEIVLNGDLLTSQSNQIDLTSMPTGTYLLKIEDYNHTATFPLMIIK